MVTEYANLLLGERCLVHLFGLYVSLLSEKAKNKDLFYCKPRKNVLKEDKYWYFSIPIGHNPLSCRLKPMYNAAGVDPSGINNHGLRAFGLTCMYAEGVPEKLLETFLFQFFRLQGNVKTCRAHAFTRFLVTCTILAWKSFSWLLFEMAEAKYVLCYI